jgi:hypothetical protein
MKKVITTALFLCALLQIEAQTWVAKKDFPGTARSRGVAFSIGNFGYMGLGDSKSQDFWKYTPATDTWSAAADFPGVARNGAVAAVVNGKAYIGLGGLDGSFGDPTAYYDDFYEYDPATNKWTKKASIPNGGIINATYFGFDNINGGTVYVLMGQKVGKSVTSDVYSYTVSSDTWKKIDNVKMPAEPYPLHSTASFKWNNKAYFAGGKNESTIYTSFYEFDPAKLATNPWTLINTNDDYTMGYRCTAFGIGNKAYACYGNKANMIVFDATTTQMTTKTDPLKIKTGFSSPLEQPMSFVINNQAFLFGGINVFTPSPKVWAFGTPSIAVKEQAALDLKIQYNNADKQLTIQGKAAIEAVNVFGIDGRLVHTFSPNGAESIQTFDCSSIPSGLYICHITNDAQQSQSYKFEIQ